MSVDFVNNVLYDSFGIFVYIVQILNEVIVGLVMVVDGIQCVDGNIIFLFVVVECEDLFFVFWFVVCVFLMEFIKF